MAPTGRVPQEADAAMSDLPDEHLQKGPSDGVGRAPPRPIPLRASPDEVGPLPAWLQLSRPDGGLWRGQVHCPYCLAMIEVSVIGLCTYLGPSLLQCRGCDRQLLSHRREWDDQTEPGRAWYVMLSL